MFCFSEAIQSKHTYRSRICIRPVGRIVALSSSWSSSSFKKRWEVLRVIFHNSQHKKAFMWEESINKVITAEDTCTQQAPIKRLLTHTYICVIHPSVCGNLGIGNSWLSLIHCYMSTEDMHAQKLQDVARLPSHQIWCCSKNPTDLTDLQKPSGPSATDLATTLPTDFSSDSTWTRLNLLVLAVCVTLWVPIMSLWHQHSEHSDQHNLRSHIGSCYCTTKAQQCRLWTQQLSADLWNLEVQKESIFHVHVSCDATLCHKHVYSGAQIPRNTETTLLAASSFKYFHQTSRLQLLLTA